MASPSTALRTLRPDIGTLMEFDLEKSWMGFIGYDIFPVVNVGRAAGNFGRIKLNEMLQTRNTSRAPGAGYSRSTFEFEEDSYATAEHGHEEPVDESEAHMYADYFDHLMVSTTRCYDAILRNAEQRVATKAFDINSTEGVTTTAVSNGVWDPVANPTGTPLEDFSAVKTKIRNRCGRTPNAMAMDWQVFEWLINHPEIIERVKYQGYQDARAGEITRQSLALAFNVDRLIVSGDGSMVNTTNQGQTGVVAPVLASIYPTTRVLAFVSPETDDPREVCYGRTFHWTGEDAAHDDGSEIGGHVEIYRQEEVRSDIVRVRHHVQERFMYKECGELITGTSA